MKMRERFELLPPLTHIWLNSPLFLLRRQMWYDRVPFITETSLHGFLSCTLSLPLTLGQTETFHPGELSTWVTLSLMLNLVPKCHKQSHSPGTSTCHRAFIVLGTTQSCFFQLIWEFCLLNKGLFLPGKFKTTTRKH